MSEVTLHLDGDPVAKERDFYRAKLEAIDAFVFLSMTFRNCKERQGVCQNE